MGNREFRTFKVGDVFRILEDRIESWQSAENYTVAKVHDHGHMRGVGHSQSLTMTDGSMFSGWWFDPAAECLWARETAIA